MFLNVLQSQWLLLALVGGPVLILTMVLSYLALWRPREPAGTAPAEGRQTVRQWLRSFLPWVLVLVYVGMAVYVVAYTLAAAAHPPNW